MHVLDPQARALLALAAASGRPELNTLTPEAARKQYLEVLPQLVGQPKRVRGVEDRKIPGPAGTIPVRIYRPDARSGESPVLAYFHGGGWVIGNVESHDHVCRWLCAESGSVVVSVDYRLAPEHKFPAAVEDAYAATAWVAENCAGLGADPSRLAVGGDSAGGNLAAVVSQLARDRRGPPIRFQLLIYPATDQTFSFPSHAQLASGYRLTRPLIEYFAGHYLRGEADKTDPRASPLFAQDLSGLPPALVVIAGFDPLRDEGKAYAEKLRQHGVAAQYVCYEGMIHGFFHMPGALDQARKALDEASAALRTALR